MEISNGNIFYDDSACDSAGRDPSLLGTAFSAVAEREASQNALQMVAVKVKSARVMAVLKRLEKAVLRLLRAEELIQFSQRVAEPLMAAQPTRVWGPAQARTPALALAWAGAAKRMAEGMTAERMMVGRVVQLAMSTISK
jgi:hypothetical protein